MNDSRRARINSAISNLDYACTDEATSTLRALMMLLDDYDEGHLEQLPLVSLDGDIISW
jgi:hypothetical protein